MRATVVPVCTGDSSALRPRNDNRCHPLIVILGPTSSGKSDLAVEIARKFGGEIISADSRQVYREMDLGTGKVPRDKIFNFQFLISKQISIRQLADKSQITKKYYFYKGIPHHLLNVASPKRRLTVAQYKKLAQEAIKDIQKRGKIPILCGGTGLYIQAVVDDLQIPAVKPNCKLRAQLEKKPVGELFSVLKRLDPERAANIDPKNPRRLIRAIEIVKTTGKPVPALNPPHPSFEKGGIIPPFFKGRIGGIHFHPLFLGIKKSPAELKKLIHKRLLNRFKQGMIKEVAGLRNSGISWRRLESFGLEYRWIARFLQKKISREEMISRLQKESERYAKRQMTWFKRDPRIHWITNKKQARGLVKRFLENPSMVQNFDTI